MSQGEGTWAAESLAKAWRCKAAGCPLAGKRDRRCEACTGPVAWRDGSGRQCGKARSCHDCPMDGLGLPVCWAACAGPGLEFSTDGQCMVTMGGMETPSEFLARNAASIPVVRSGTCTASLTEGEEACALAVIRGISRLDGRQWVDFLRAFRDARPGSKREAARMVGLPTVSFDSPDSPQSRIVKALEGFSAEDFCVLRHRMGGANCSQTARRLLVTKQAVSKREKNMRRKAAWYARFLDGEERSAAGRKGFSAPKGDITPRKAEGRRGRE